MRQKLNMSEHMEVTGNVKYIHMPYREENGFTWCKKCKKYAESLVIHFDESPFGDSISVICGKCKMTIYVADISKRKYAKKDTRCSGCKKQISRYDAYTSVHFSDERCIKHFCSGECEKKAWRNYGKKHSLAKNQKK